MTRGCEERPAPDSSQYGLDRIRSKPMGEILHPRLHPLGAKPVGTRTIGPTAIPKRRQTRRWVQAHPYRTHLPLGPAPNRMACAGRPRPPSSRCRRSSVHAPPLQSPCRVTYMRRHRRDPREARAIQNLQFFSRANHAARRPERTSRTPPASRTRPMPDFGRALLVHFSDH